MNQVQVIGTHNSYHRESPLEARAVQSQLLPNVINYYYSHATLDIQASYQSVRSFELDIFADPDGGRYANPLVIRNSSTALPPQDIMNKPGVKILHVADADVWPSCYTLIDCLTVVKTWSQAHPDHVPIPFMIEFKTAETGTGGSVPPLPWNNSALLDSLDAEIRSVFPPSKLITADDLRRPDLTLEASVLQHGWPDLDSARGRVLFLMDNAPGPIRDVYTFNRPNLEDRVIFTNSVPGSPDCAFQKLNDPRGEANLANIQAQVRAGYWVRTRADEPLTTILGNDRTAMRDAAWRSGAQIVRMCVTKEKGDGLRCLVTYTRTPETINSTFLTDSEDATQTSIVNELLLQADIIQNKIFYALLAASGFLFVVAVISMLFLKRYMKSSNPNAWKQKARFKSGMRFFIQYAFGLAVAAAFSTTQVTGALNFATGAMMNPESRVLITGGKVLEVIQWAIVALLCLVHLATSAMSCADGSAMKGDMLEGASF
ncbi:uncharacterized protein GGS22DRAFT_191771 [Annulohypoxylon maeteangense]|uniref:uncharacterized protein n=1 Tax=Annulohypoxylon maeteangense TaxID=1927788 RepID=UPI002008B310|nr:uncharacterized protein GGS22DRAFT_191771 [Annulohypoxylon maeteangense]KAI0882040.1 hypothetical protein GGS22DRAFT_191771 [Annulohypoxylon maeteangense]